MRYSYYNGVSGESSNKLTLVASSILLALMVTFMTVVQSVSAASSTVTVTGNTSAGENQPGWLFNRDMRTSTPYEFNSDQESIGSGSLYVKPISNTNTSGLPGNDPNKDKFIAENFVQSAVSEFDSVSYDFLIAGPSGTASDASEFYLNVYANIDNSTNFYDCRYDYVPSVGSTLGFTTASFSSTDTPTTVTKRGDRIPACPATLAEMPEGSHVRVFAINVGGTSDSDTGLAGYLDNVVVNASGNTTTYDFEPRLTVANKDACKNGGWMTSNTPVYKNQGQCVSSFASNKNN